MMSILRSQTSVVVTLLIGLSVIGCGKGTGETAVSGRATYKGAPISNAALIFFPGVGRSTNVTSDADGNYSTSLTPGEYTVTVMIGVELPPGWKEGQPIPRQKIMLPPQYGKRTQTPLKATVAAGQSDPINFDLK
jgi:hypothetical protein